MPIEAATASQPRREEQAAPSIRLQLTGDNAAGTAQLPARPASANVVNEVMKAAAELTEAFGSTDGKSVDSGKAGFDDGFDAAPVAHPPTPEPLTKAKTTTTINKHSNAFNAGFGDSFTPTRLGDAGRAGSSKTIALPVSNEQKAAVAADGEPSFEDRYPSLEALAARHSDPPQVVFTKSPEVARVALPSDETGSQARPNKLTDALRQRSFHQPSLTGGSSSFDQAKHRFFDNEARPLARSGQVTGTAFKAEDMSTSPVSAYKPPMDLLDSLDAPEPSRRAPSPLQERTPHLPPRPREVVHETISPGVAPQSLTSMQAMPVQEAASRQDETRPMPPMDLLTGDPRDSPQLSYYSMRPMTRNAGSEKNKPPTAAKPAGLAGIGVARTGQAGVAEPQRQSSLLTDEWTPLKDAKALLSQNSAGHDGSGSQVKIPPQSPKPDHLRRSVEPRAERPNTIHISPLDQSPALLDNPPASAGRVVSASTSTPERRPGSLSRSNSITALVSRYEAISSPKQETNGFDIPGGQKPRGSTVPKPAPKPAQLRAGQQAQEEVEAGSNISRSRSMYLPASKSAGLAGRRESVERPIRPSELSTGLEMRRSSSRSVHSISEEKDKVQERRGDEGEEKPKSVGSLIARWNQAGPPAQGTSPASARARAPIGTGRRL